MSRKIFKTGNSLVISLSKNALEKAGLKVGEAVDVEAKDGYIIVSKSKKGRQQDLGLKVRSKL
jgi:antitoxin component of MazEF toxin-antitoxin module